MLRVPETVCIVLHMGQPDPLAVAIGSAARGAITEAGLSLTSFAETAGFSWGTLSRRINGQTAFTYSELVRIADVTGITVAELVARADRLHGAAA